MKAFNFKRVFTLSIFAFVCCVWQVTGICGQSAAPGKQTAADENFELNISSERITETNFERSTALNLTGDAANGTENVRLEVGVGVCAARIDITLRGVTGRVSFRGSLDVVRQKIEANRAGGTGRNLPSP